MARRLVRTGVQLGLLVTFAILLVVFLDNQFRVLPDSIHGHLPMHYSGYVITDVTVTKCSSLNPFLTCKLDPAIWYRIDKDLYLRSGWTSTAYVQFQRKKEEELTADDRVVVDLKISRLTPPTEYSPKGEVEAWEPRPGGIWLKRSASRHASDSGKAVTYVDVLFGADAVDPRMNWEVKDTPLLLDGWTEKLETRLSIRRGNPTKSKKPTPRINENGKFRVMQLADLHLSTGLGACRDPIPAEFVPGQKCEADPRTLEFVARLLDEEKPDMVILSGDQVNGETSPDAQSAVFKGVQLLIDRKIPYAVIFGNHDDEGDLNRAQLMSIYEDLPYSLAAAGPEDIDGVGNYIVEVLDRGKSTHSALTLYLLDTHSYSPDERQFRGYDWIKPSQIRWFKNTAQGLRRKHLEYSHIHMNLAFIHIPLPEYRSSGRYVKGAWDEAPTAPGFNSGFKDALQEEGVLFVSCGHDHVNDYCMLEPDANDKPSLWMCYGGGSGLGGYGGYNDYVRRVRFFDFEIGPGRVTTYKRLEWGQTEAKIDEMMIVDGGAVKGPSEAS
ncbi:hypothetical protein N7448_004837 [Penicillium atrosanguineum]|uniref:Calcineurin-like phosphoesterase domain-containing protein n=1 Tax=Penicillium atrosanguineum TaxID=1132637 RepID=A0A9W9U0I1_9EURO|nr:uncharacterized protein N7443_008587 [Penicillium atrosanguineum]KAJ5125517.1 hypothetical protein N7526_007694 [Penicillium atrosanguineum]KAJ5136283.1 hypothetical protein N7448_004837 [Penicillium atrosanguineum]KAJ5292634.1 hypothetical protein N7443_008587 [Penicillium atrosanguineum]KAJ5303342.1 hypothetical protein N7476_010141 [Penicillium atrosanguineum]